MTRGRQVELPRGFTRPQVTAIVHQFVNQLSKDSEVDAYWVESHKRCTFRKPESPFVHLRPVPADAIHIGRYRKGFHAADFIADLAAVIKQAKES